LFVHPDDELLIVLLANRPTPRLVDGSTERSSMTPGY